MKRKNKVVLLILLIFTLIAAAGCGVKAPKVAVMEAMQKQAKTVKFDGEIKLELTGQINDNDPSLALLKDLKIAYDGAYQEEPQKAVVNVKAQMLNTTVEMNMYIDGKKMYLKLPMQEKYGVLDLDQIEKEAKKSEKTADTKKNEQLYKEMALEVYSTIDQAKFKDAGNEKINGVQSRVIKIELDNKDFISLMKQFAQTVGKEKYKELLNLPTNSPDAAKQDVAKELEKSINEMEKEVDFNKCILTLAIDKQGYVNNTKLDSEIKSKKENQGFKITINSNSKDFGKPQDIKFPEFNNKNTVPYEKLLQGFLGAGLSDSAPTELPPGYNGLQPGEIPPDFKVPGL